MKKFLVIGNPIDHSLSPKIHNFWIKENNLDAIYEKKKINENNIEEIITDIKEEKLYGANVTVPFKKSVIPFMDELTKSAQKTESVNTIYKKLDKIVGDNTDVGGFEKGLEYINYNVANKKILILGAGGVVSSIIFALKNLGATDITISNRTKKKASDIKIIYPDLKIIDWGEVFSFDVIINATSLGLKKEDRIDLNLNADCQDKLFYDVIYNPQMTNFLQKGQKLGNKIENGKMMFIYQAQLAFKIWHNILPKVNEELIRLLSE